MPVHNNGGMNLDMSDNKSTHCQEESHITNDINQKLNVKGFVIYN